MGKGRILIVSPYFYPEGGGLERYAFWMAKELLKGYNVEVLCMTRGEERFEEFDGLRVHRVKPGLILSNTPLSLRFAFRAVNLVKRADYVIAHTPVPFAVDIASFIAKLRNIPIKVVYHTVGLKKGEVLLDVIAAVYSSTVERLTLRNVKITAVSHVVWTYLKGKGYNADISYPPLMIDRSTEHRTTKKEKIILFVGQLGRYHRFKNLDLLIRAFSKVSLEFPKWELWVVGDGDLLDYYKGLAAKLGIPENVRFLGRVDNPERLKYIYSIASILVLPSFFESFGMVVPEALSAGTSVVISPHVGARVLVENGKNGLLLEDVSADSLENAIKYLIENPKRLRKMSHISKTSIASYPSPQFQL